MHPKHLPADINAESLLLYLQSGAPKVALRGKHKRDAYNDIVSVEEDSAGTLTIGLARDSLYNVLPEYMFHPIDRFSNIPDSEKEERFAEEIRAQEAEKENARRFFEPLDIMLLKLKCDVCAAIEPFAEANIVLEHVLADTLTEAQRENRFVRQSLRFLPFCKLIRGDKTLLTLMLRKVLCEEGVRVEAHKQQTTFTDVAPRYDFAMGSTLGEAYAGNVFDETVWHYDVHFWSAENCDEHFLDFVADIDVFRTFVADYFLFVEDVLSFCLVRDESPLRLGDTFLYNYLDYNTNI